MRLAAVGHEVVLGSRSAERAEEVRAGLLELWPGRDLAIGAADNAGAAAADVVVVATPWDGAAPTVAALAEALDGKVVISMANAWTRVGKEFQPLIPPRGSVAADVQAALPGASVAAAFHHRPRRGAGARSTAPSSATCSSAPTTPGHRGHRRRSSPTSPACVRSTPAG